MRLIVDSSVALKWFVTEPNDQLAKSLLDANERLTSPDLILTEVTNALWRKTRGDQTTKAQVRVAIEEMVGFLNLVRVDAQLLLNALDLGQKLSHSIYDCVFLACALEPNSALVTADVKFAEKAAAAGFADRIRVLGDAPILVAFSESSLKILSELFERFRATRDFVESQVARPSGSSNFVVINSAEIRPAFDSPVYRRLTNEIARLTPHQAANLIATCWLGRGYDGRNYGTLYGQAGHLAAVPQQHAAYIISLLHHLAAGIALSRQR